MWAAAHRAAVNEGSKCTNRDKVTGTVWLLTCRLNLKGFGGHNSTYQATLGLKQRFSGSTNNLPGGRL